jgi:hypothetical protein
MFWPFTQWPYGNITSGEAANRQLVLEETTHRAAVRDLKFHDDEVKGERNAVVNTKVTVPNGDGSTVKAGDTAEFLPVTDGMFPLGTTEGVLKITSPQMAKALEVDYRVHARWSIWLIPVLCLIGFGLGYVVRRLLETRKLRTNAKRKAYAQLAVLTQAGKEAQDATFRGAIESAKTALQMAAAGRLVEDIDKAVTAATSALQVAKEQLDGSLKELAARVEPWRGMMIAARQLPGLVEKRWLDTQNAFKRVTTLIGLKNPQEADAAFLEMRVNQMLPLVKELAGWRGGMPDLLEELVRWPGAPKDDIPTVVNGWKNEWITANASAAAHRALRDDVTPQTASLELYASETAHQQALQLADLYGRLVKDLAYDSALSLREHVVPKDRAESSGKAMEEASATLADAFADVVGLPLKDAREKLQEALTTHHQAWLANLQSLAGVDNEIEKQAIHDALLKGDYAAAVRVVTKVAPAPANLPEGGPAAMLGIRGDGGNTRFLGFGVPSNNSNPAGMSFPYPAMARAESDEPLYRPLTPGEIHIRILELEQKGIQLEFLQTALLAILFTLAAIAIYHESWVGTWQQVAMVLAWAFATDFTTEKLVAAAKATSLKPV